MTKEGVRCIQRKRSLGFDPYFCERVLLNTYLSCVSSLLFYEIAEVLYISCKLHESSITEGQIRPAIPVKTNGAGSQCCCLWDALPHCLVLLCAVLFAVSPSLPEPLFSGFDFKCFALYHAVSTNTGALLVPSTLCA